MYNLKCEIICMRYDRINYGSYKQFMAVESNKIKRNNHLQNESEFTPSQNISVDDSQCENRLGKKKDFGYEVCDIISKYSLMFV